MKPLLEAINFTINTINNPRFIYKNIYQEMIDIQLNYNSQYCPIIFEDNSIDYDTDYLYETLDMIFESELLNYDDKLSFTNELVQSVLESTNSTPKSGIKIKLSGFGTTIKNKMLSSDLGRRVADAHRYSNASWSVLNSCCAKVSKSLADSVVLPRYFPTSISASSNAISASLKLVKSIGFLMLSCLSYTVGLTPFSPIYFK